MWFAGEARVGQKTRITRRWARRGTRPPPRRTPCPAGPPPRPSAPQDQRTAFPCIFGAICPKDGKAAGVRREMRPPDSFLIRFTLPLCNTQATGLHLADISGRIAPACPAAA